MAVLSATGFASLVVIGKLAYDAGADVLTLLTGRFVIASVVLWLLAAHRGVIRGVTRRDVLGALALGGILYSVETALTFAALERLDASMVELLLFCYPALVVVGAIVLRHERASRRRLVALALATGGVMLVLAGSAAGTLDPLGTALALGAAVLYAAYVLGAAKFDGRLHPLTFSALISTGAAISITSTGAASGSLNLGMGWAAWGCAAALALLATVIAVTAFLGGVARLGPGRAAILATLEPPLACVLAFFVFGERLTPLQLAGGALVVSAAVVLQVRPLRSRNRGASPRTTDHAPARPLAAGAAGGRRMGVRAQVRRLPGARVRGREPDRAPVARR